MSQYHWVVTGHLRDARAFGERAETIAGTLADPALRAVANYYAGAATFASTDYPTAESFLKKALPTFEGELGRERFGLAGYPAVMSRWVLASSLAERGQFDEALRYAEEGWRTAEEVRHPYSLILASWGLALVHVLKGEFSPAASQLEQGLALCRDWSVPVLSPITAGFLGYVQLHLGRVGDGLAALQKAMRDQESTGLALYHSRLVLWLSEGLMRAGQLDEALDQAQRAMALTRERGEHGLQAWALYLLGELASRREPPDVETADVHYRDALTIAEADDLQPLVARCHDGLGKLYRTAGRRSEAREHLLLAASLYGRMQMQFWLDQTKPQFDALA